MNRISRMAAVGIVALMALTLPRTGFSDVDLSDGTLTKLEGEPCPPAEEVALEDLEYEGAGCSAVGVEALVEELPTTCRYALESVCDGGGSSRTGC